jgi:hypothetical protein
LAVSATVLFLLAAGEAWAGPRGGGGARGGGNASFANRGGSAAHRAPAAHSPAAARSGQRSGARPGLPSPPAAGARPGNAALPGHGFAGQRPSAGTNRPVQPGTRAANHPSAAELANHVNAHPFTPGWYARHPGVWAVANPWVVPTWAAVAAWVGVAAQPVGYAYPTSSNTVVYAAPASEEAIAETEPAQNADQIAAADKDAADPNAQWMELGVFALTADGQAQPTAMVQLSVSKDGAVKGTHYDVLTDTTQPLSGSVDKTTQRVVWSLASNKSVVYETSLLTLTGTQGAMLIHFPGNQSQRWNVARVAQNAS